MTKEIYYLDDALQGIDFDTATLDRKFWFRDENGWETYSKTEYEKIKNYSSGVLLAIQNHVDDYGYEFEDYVTYYLEDLLQKYL